MQLQAGKPAPGIVRIIDDPRAEEAQSGHYLAGVLALILFVAIVAASFHPFQPIHDPVRRAARLQDFLHSIGPNSGNLQRLEPGHLCLNFFFYFPLGVLVAAALRRRVKGVGPWLLYVGALGLGFVMSLTIEYQQIGFNGRDPDLSDTVMNSLGYVAGFGLIRWLIRSGRFRTEALFGRGSISDRQGVARLLGVAYCLLLLVAGLLRPAFTSERYGFQSPPHHVLNWTPQDWRDPLDPWTLQRVLIVVAVGVGFIPVGFLFRASHYFWNHQRHLLCLVFAAALAAVLEAVHLTLPGKTCDLARIAAATLGAMAGADLAGWRRRR